MVRLFNLENSINKFSINAWSIVQKYVSIKRLTKLTKS